MYLLDKHQVERIVTDVETARITISQLSQELVDHICCEVESHMDKGKSFEEAYAIVKSETGIKVLQKIQENTLYLIDKKYAFMKTTMKITGNISLALLAAGTLQKIFMWPGASPTLVLGFLLLCLVFFPSAIYLDYNEKKIKRPLLSLSILIGGIAFMIGILFKVMAWPGANILLFSGWISILGIYLPFLLFVKLKESSDAKEKNIYVLGVISIILFETSAMFKMFRWPGTAVLMLLGSVFLTFSLCRFTYFKMKTSAISIGQFIFLITLSMYATVLTSLMSLHASPDVFLKAAEENRLIVRYFEQKKNNVTASIPKDSSAAKVKNTTLISSAEELHQFIKNIELNLIQEAEDVNRTNALQLLDNPQRILRKDNTGMVNEIMFRGDNNLAESLRKRLDNFRQEASLAIADDNETASEIDQLLNTSFKKESWEKENFSNAMLINALAFLNAEDKNIYQVESRIQSINSK